MNDISLTTMSRQTGLLQELEILANNIANAGTAGYKREASVFTEYVATGARSESLSMGNLRGHYAVFEEGAFIETGGVFDIAISGPGLFAVETPTGTYLTRGGQFQLDAEGQLVTPEGNPVLDEGGGAITIPPEAIDIAVSTDGIISIDGLATAQLGVFSAPVGSLVRMGNNLWQATESYEFIDDPIVRQGFVEQSNVNPILEMARLIEAQRLFEAGQSLLETDQQRKAQMMQLLGAQR